MQLPGRDHSPSDVLATSIAATPWTPPRKHVVLCMMLSLRNLLSESGAARGAHDGAAYGEPLAAKQPWSGATLIMMALSRGRCGHFSLAAKHPVGATGAGPLPRSSHHQGAVRPPAIADVSVATNWRGDDAHALQSCVMR